MTRLVWALGGLLCLACGEEGDGLPDPGDQGARVDLGPADGSTLEPDGSVDLGPDAGTDAGIDGGTDAGTDGGTGDGGVVCGNQSCEAAEIQLPLRDPIVLPGCCLEDAPQTCGVDTSAVDFESLLGSDFDLPILGCVPRSFEGELDPQCPDLRLQVGPLPLTLAGCCRPDGFCGQELDLRLLDGPDFGCVPTSTAPTTETATTCGT